MFPTEKNVPVYPPSVMETILREVAYVPISMYIGHQPELVHAIALAQQEPIQAFFSPSLQRDHLEEWHKHQPENKITWRFFNADEGLEHGLHEHVRLILIDGYIAEWSLEDVRKVMECCLAQGTAIAIAPVYNGLLEWQPSDPMDGQVLRFFHQWLAEWNHSGEKAPADLVSQLEHCRARIQHIKHSVPILGKELSHLLQQLYRSAYDVAPVSVKTSLTTWLHTRRYYAQVQKLRLNLGFSVIIGRPILEEPIL